MDFFSHFVMPDALLALVKSNLYDSAFAPTFIESPPGYLYFGPAQRNNMGNEKKDVLGTRVLWVDADDAAKPLTTLSPSITVWSGHGWHLYWFLAEPIMDVELIEYYNKLLIADVPTADKACWNANRLMRIPGTVNMKDPSKPVPVEVRAFGGTVYERADFDAMSKLSPATKHKIRTGDRRGYRSRSERDWAIVREMQSKGASDALIKKVFTTQPCGDKFRDEGTAATYLDLTISRAQDKAVEPEQGFIDVTENGYYVPGRRGSRRISTFTIDPTLLLDGSTTGAGDAIVGIVSGSSYTWPDVTFTRAAFTSVARLDRECPVSAWQWLGRDEDLRQLLPFLLDRLRSKGLPKVIAVPNLGLHFHKGEPYYVGDKQVLSATSVWEGYKGPLAWLPNGKEHPEMDLTVGEYPDWLGDLPKLNDPGPFWIMLGWYAAAMFKPWLEGRKFRFPILTVTGTKGSGKTTLLQRVFMPLFGQVTPKSFDAGTTRFVMLSILGNTNAVPVAFSEFRYESVANFIRYILLAYDTGHDPRGRADQTTIDYPLCAPFSVDGEDLIADPAARERIVVAALHPDTVKEGTECYETYRRLRDYEWTGIAGSYIQFGLRSIVDGTAEVELSRAVADVFEAFPRPMPDRIRNNHIVAWFGVRMFAAATAGRVGLPSVGVCSDSISRVFDIESGRSRTLVDDFTEDVINSMPNGYFKYAYAGSVLHIQMAGAYNWWAAHRRRAGRTCLEREAITVQLREAGYYVGSSNQGGIWMYGIDLKKAQELGLDVPDKLNIRTFKVDF